MKEIKKVTIPTCLTLLRLIGAPFLVPFLIVNYLPQNNCVINSWIAALFLFFGFTDFLDGYVARRYAQTSDLGAILDHLADKCLIFSTLIALLAIHKIYYVWVLLLIGREFFIMGLREIALKYAMSIPVSSFGKLKTCIHIVLMTWIILNPSQAVISLVWNSIELILLCISLFLSWYSAFHYFFIFYAQLKDR